MHRPQRRPRARFVALIALALVLALTGCKKKNEGVTLGLYASMTGAQAEFGNSTRNGIQLAVDEVNAQGGLLGKPVRFVYEDDRGDSNEATNAVSRLIDREGVTGILGEIASTLSLSGGRVAQRRHVPMITPSSTNEAVTQIGDYVFRVCFIDNFQGAVMAGFVRNTLHMDRVAIFKDQGSAYSAGLAEVFRREFTRMGGTIVDEQSYRETDTHFSAQLGSIRSHDPQAIFVPGYYTQVALLAREARGLGFTGPFLGTDGWDAPPLYQNDEDALVGSYFSESFAGDHPVTARGRAFVENYRTRYHAAANGLAALGYDSGLVMMDAIRRAGSTDAAKIRDAIAGTQGFEGATGRITIDANRNAVKSAVILQVDAGGFHFHSEVAPESIH